MVEPLESPDELRERRNRERTESGLPPLERSWSIKLDGFTSGSTARIVEAFERAVRELRRDSRNVGGTLAGENDDGSGYVRHASDIELDADSAAVTGKAASARSRSGPKGRKAKARSTAKAGSKAKTSTKPTAKRGLASRSKSKVRIGPSAAGPTRPKATGTRPSRPVAGDAIVHEPIERPSDDPTPDATATVVRPGVATGTATTDSTRPRPGG